MDCKDKEIRKPAFGAKTQFIYDFKIIFNWFQDAKDFLERLKTVRAGLTKVDEDVQVINCLHDKRNTVKTIKQWNSSR